MISLPRMLLIGACARDAGKTELASRVIRELASRGPVLGLKVTVISAGEHCCPRGGEGCGACELEQDFSLCEETLQAASERKEKDTQRMLQAGAERVWWLRVREGHMEKAIQALLEVLPPHAPIVAESNRLRRALYPGVFLVVRNAASKQVKPSCQEVMPLADRLVLRRESEFDLDLERLVWTGERFALRRQATAVILAGGRSRRMGKDKAHLQIEGESLVDRAARQLEPFVDELLLSGPLERFPSSRHRVVPDREPDLGPMMAISSCLHAASHELVLFIPVDMPVLPVELLLDLLRKAEQGHDVVVPVAGELHEPLFAVYKRAVRGQIDTMLAQGERRILDLYPLVDTARIQIPRGLPNVNTPLEWAAWGS